MFLLIIKFLFLILQYLMKKIYLLKKLKNGLKLLIKKHHFPSIV